MENDRLTPEKKLELVRGMAQADNVADYARQVGVDRSYLYQLRSEADSAMLNMWRERNPGRPSEDELPTGAPVDKYAAKKIKRLEREVQHWRIPAQAMALMLNALVEAGLVKKRLRCTVACPSRTQPTTARPAQARCDGGPMAARPT